MKHIAGILLTIIAAILLWANAPSSALPAGTVADRIIVEKSAHDPRPSERSRISRPDAAVPRLDRRLCCAGGDGGGDSAMNGLLGSSVTGFLGYWVPRLLGGFPGVGPPTPTQ